MVAEEIEEYTDPMTGILELMTENMFAEALDAINLALSENPENAELYRAKAECLQNLDEIEEALAAATIAVDADPQNTLNHYCRSILLYHSGRYAEAYDECRAALSLPLNQELAVAGERFSNAEDAYIDGVLHHEISCLRALSRFDEAAEVYAYLLTLDNTNMDDHLWYSDALFWAGKHEDALAEAEFVLRSTPDNADAYYLAVRCYGEMGEYEKAVETCYQSLSLYPDDATCYGILAGYLSALERYSEAVDAYDMRIQMLGEENTLLDAILKAQCLKKLGEIEKTEEVLHRIIEISMIYESHYLARGSAYLELKDYDAALQSFRIARQSDDASSADLDELISMLEELQNQ